MTTIRRLEYFISVANNLSFTKAADECFVAETAISQNIAKLEEEISFKLFERNNRKVKLTPAGEAFFKEAKYIVNRYKKAVQDCKAIALKNNHLIKIGFVTQYERPIVSRILKDFIRFYPHMQILISQYSYKMLIKALKSGEMDVAFLSPVFPEHLSDLEIKQISRESFCVAVCKTHPFASMKKISRDMLENEKIILMTPPWEFPHSTEWMNKIREEFRLREENLVSCTGNIDAALLMAELNMGLCLAFSSYRKNMRSDTLVFVELDEECPTSEIVAVYSKSNKKTAVRQFLEFVNGNPIINNPKNN